MYNAQYIYAYTLSVILCLCCNSCLFYAIVTVTVKQSTVRWRADCGAVRCGAVRCGAVRCGAMRCGAVRYSTVQYSTVQYSTVQYSKAQHSAAQRSAAQHSKAKVIRFRASGFQSGLLVHSIHSADDLQVLE